jgi:hypothetical protein
MQYLARDLELAKLNALAAATLAVCAGLHIPMNMK